MTKRSTGGRTIRVGAVARVEGEGGMVVRLRDGRVDGVQLRIYEPPRFFEALLQGRAFTEPPDITARICGICPVAYQMTACLAIEAACGVRPALPEWLSDLPERPERVTTLPVDQTALEHHILATSRAAHEGAAA